MPGNVWWSIIGILLKTWQWSWLKESSRADVLMKAVEMPEDSTFQGYQQKQNDKYMS